MPISYGMALKMLENLLLQIYSPHQNKAKEIPDNGLRAEFLTMYNSDEHACDLWKPKSRIQLPLYPQL